ncbi:hypothetical protein P691DRAFT_65885 [Macrolepiota fuliginosa MF-IS2]|uniref:Small ribosomal subunit protein mS23 n=1 Tax=Macrolepiota fuliginosa MF-IS2 TaxID=1400762 RepID=A0A9P6C3Y2_9AGAR|nr:hypothetical protein P691DRAFT_65885 [Macrolepiota fuliginosa MF-IS2]
MVRRFANQVHQQVSRLMRANYIKKEPAWYQAVLQYPPLPLPPRAPPIRTEYDQQSSGPVVTSGQATRLRKLKPRPLPIKYIEDDVRRQFFRDHPFEAFRPKTLVEGAGIESPHSVKGEEWMRLRQRGRNPSPEDAIQFAVNLHQHHNLSLSQAYLRAVAQFRALRSEHHIASTFAVNEAETFGAIFENTEIENTFEREKKALESWKQEEQTDEGAIAARKRWKAIVERNIGESEWTKGEEYVRLWKENVKAEFSPELTQPVAQTAGAAPAVEAQQVPASSQSHVHVRL